MTSKDIHAIRGRAWHYLSHEVAQRAGITLADLQQFIAGTVQLNDQQLRALARRMSVELTS